MAKIVLLIKSQANLQVQVRAMAVFQDNSDQLAPAIESGPKTQP